VTGKHVKTCLLSRLVSRGAETPALARNLTSVRPQPQPQMNAPGQVLSRALRCHLHQEITPLNSSV